MLSHAELLHKCVEIIESFNPKKTTVDAHFTDSPVINDKMAPAESKFIQQVLYGTSRYSKLLKIFVHSFLYKNPTVAPWSDQTVYLVFGYILLFRLEELGVEDFRTFLFAGLSTPPALNALLIFTFSEEDLNEWCMEAWCKIYDETFLEDGILSTLRRFKPLMAGVMADIAFHATGTSTTDTTTGEAPEGDTIKLSPKRQVTVPVPFTLTRPKPRLVPQPTAIDRVIEAQPIPKTIYKTSLEQLEKERAERLEEMKKKTESKYNEKQEFILTTAQRPGADDKIKERFRDECEKMGVRECTFQPKINPAYNRDGIADTQVKMNTAAILREDKSIRKRQDKEYGVLKNYEAELRDCSQFNKWQQEMRDKDDLEEDLRVEERKLELQAARQQAIDSSIFDVKKKTVIAQVARAQITDKLEEVSEQNAQELENKQTNAMEVKKMRENSNAERQKITAIKEDQGIILRKEMKDAQEQKKKEDDIEMEKKRDLIRQILACERVLNIGQLPARFDPNEPPDKLLDEEMCYTELLERLRMMKQQIEYERKTKHADIIVKKEVKKKDLEKKVDGLKHIRCMAKSDAELRRQNEKAKKEAEEITKENFRRQRKAKVDAKIAQKQKERADEAKRLSDELKEISTRRQFDDLKTGKDSATLKAEDVEKGLERYRKMVEDKEENERKGIKLSFNRDTKIRVENIKEKQRSITNLRTDVDERIHHGKKERAFKDEMQGAMRHEFFTRTIKFEKGLRKERDKTAAYAASKRQYTIEGGRTYRAEQAKKERAMLEKERTIMAV